MARIAYLIFIVFLACFATKSWGYSYDVHLPVSNQVNVAFEGSNLYYDGTPNLCYSCIYYSNENLQEKTLGWSFFAFKVSLVAPKGGSILSQSSSAAFRAADDIGDFVPKNKHLLGGGSQSKARFNTSDVGEVRSLIQEALRSPNAHS